MCEQDAEHRIIIPPDKAVEIVRGASQAYLRECPCRAQEQLCPRDAWEVCLLFESAPPDTLRNARPISTREALSILETTSARRAIYNLFYRRGDRRVTELCSCCTCCCHPLHRMRKEGNYGQQLRSDYVAVTDAARCLGCGLCVESCFFEARRVEGGTLRTIDERCFGCGRCIGSCPENAIALAQQNGRGVPISATV